MRLFTILALALAIGLGTALSPFASSSPDGLEKVAERKAFVDDEPRPGQVAALRLRDPGRAGRAAGHAAWPGSPGTLGVFAVGYGIAAVVRRRPVAA